MYMFYRTPAGNRSKAARIRTGRGRQQSGSPRAEDRSSSVASGGSSASRGFTFQFRSSPRSTSTTNSRGTYRGINLALGRRNNSGDGPTEAEVPTTTTTTRRNKAGDHKVEFEGLEPDERSSMHTASTHALSSLQAATRSRSISGTRGSAGAIEMPTVAGIGPIPEDGGVSPDTQSPRYGDVTHTSQLARGELGYHPGAAENSQGEIDMSQYMAPHSAYSDLLQDPNPNVY
jgi:hypothetical protein